MFEQTKNSQIVANEKLGNCLKCFELQAIETNAPREEVSFRFDDTSVFPGHSALQLEYLGLVEQREDRCFLTQKGLAALKEIVSRWDSSIKLLSGQDWEISKDYLC